MASPRVEDRNACGTYVTTAQNAPIQVDNIRHPAMIVGHQQRRIGGAGPMGLRGQGGGKAQGLFGVLCVAIALVWSSATKAETRVYLLRGWFGVFSTGLDTVAAELRSKG